MIIIGTYNLRRTIETGGFFCPECTMRRDYRLRSTRPFLTLYFIPTLPVGAASRYVECLDCKMTFDETILEVGQAGEFNDDRFREEALTAALLTVVADSTITENEIAALMQVSQHLLEVPTNREELGNRCGKAMEIGYTANNYLNSVAPRWSHEQRRLALKAIFLAASAEGTLTIEQLEAMVAIGKILQINDAEFESLIEEALVMDNSYNR